MLGLIAAASVASAQTAAGDPAMRSSAVQTSNGVVVSIELKNAPGRHLPASQWPTRARRAGYAGDRQRPWQEHGRAEPGRCALGQRCAIRRPFTRRSESQAADDSHGVGRGGVLRRGGAADTSTFRAAPGTASATAAQASPSSAAPVTLGHRPTGGRHCVIDFAARRERR